jgi:hypothetical protein
MGTLMASHRTAVHPVQAAAEAREAAKAAASRKAELAPHTLSEAEVLLLPGAKVLELGNAGHLRHLGVGIPTARTAAPKKKTASRSTKASLTDSQIARMSGDALAKAMAAGQVPGIGARRKGRRH